MTVSNDSDVAESDQKPSPDEGSRTTSAAVTSIILIGLAIFYLINAFLLPSVEPDEGMGPRTFPVVVAIVLLCTSVLGVLAIVRGRVEARPVTGNELLRVVVCIGLFAMYTSSIFLIGFVEASAIFSVLTTMFVFGVRMTVARGFGLLVTSLVIGMIFFLVFDIWLNVLLPVGWLEFLVFGGLNL